MVTGCSPFWKLLLLLLLLSGRLIPRAAAAGGNNQRSGVCVSPGGRFPAFSSEGKPPGRVRKGPKDLALCRVFRQRTCCDVSQTYPALLQIRKLASSGEANQECLHLWELLECSICDPHIGVQSGPPLLCASFCDMVLQACSDAYFSIDSKTQVLLPCGFGDIICGRAAEWASNGTELCQLAGFSVQSAKDSSNLEGPICYGGKTSLDSIADSWKGPQYKSESRTLNSWVLDDFNQWISEMSLGEMVSWAVGGMVLTAGLLFISKRKSFTHRRRQAAVVRTARRLESRIIQQHSTTRK